MAAARSTRRSIGRSTSGATADPRARTGRSSGWRCRRSSPWSPSRCSCSPTRRSSATSAPRQLAGLGIAGAVRADRGRAVHLPRLRHHRLGGPAARRRRPARGARPGHRRGLARGADRRRLTTLVGLAADRPAGRRCSAPGRRWPATPTTYLRMALPRRHPAAGRCWPRTGVLRGLQDTRTPLVVAVGGNLLNIALNFALVYGRAAWGIAGSAIGTDLAQLLLRGRAGRGRGPRRRAAHGASLRPDLRRHPGVPPHAGVALVSAP